MPEIKKYPVLWMYFPVIFCWYHEKPEFNRIIFFVVWIQPSSALASFDREHKSMVLTSEKGHCQFVIKTLFALN